MNNQYSDMFHPYQLSKLIVDFEKGTVIVEALSDFGVTQIDLREIAISDVDDDDVLAKFFDSDDLSAIKEFRFKHIGQFL